MSDVLVHDLTTLRNEAENRAVKRVLVKLIIRGIALGFLGGFLSGWLLRLSTAKSQHGYDVGQTTITCRITRVANTDPTGKQVI